MTIEMMREVEYKEMMELDGNVLLDQYEKLLKAKRESDPEIADIMSMTVESLPTLISRMRTVIVSRMRK